MNAAATVYDGSHKYIRITDIDDNSHLYSQDVPVSPEGQVDEKYRVRENDILFARTGASVGKSYRYQRSDGDLYYAVILSILVDTFISKISLPMQPVPEIGSISGA